MPWGYRGPHGRGKRWRRAKHRGLRRRLTFAFAFVALAAVSLTSWLTLGAVFSSQRELFGLEGNLLWQGRSDWDDPQLAPAREAFRRITRTSFFAALASFFLASGAAALVTRLLTRPLAALTDGAERLEAGERGIRLVVPPAQDELRRLTEAFNSLVAGLERQEAWRRGIVADIAHDLRTPLAVMRSEIEAMQDGLVALDGSALARLHAEVMRLSRLVDDLRTLSLAEGGGIALKLEPVALRPLLESIVRTFAPRAAQVGVERHLADMQDDLSAHLDRDRLTQILANLLDNALRYAAPGAVEVGAEPKRAPEEAGVRIWVRDHGPGLSGEALERAFERFYREDAARTRQASSGDTSGSGLGLAIARALVESTGRKAHGNQSPFRRRGLQPSLPQGLWGLKSAHSESASLVQSRLVQMSASVAR
jgi:two-component system, OmpR family, sensor histidine kinase BaeS